MSAPVLAPIPLQWLHPSSKPKYLYHYVRWHWLKNWLDQGAITLSNPVVWDDPTESLWTNWVHRHVAATVICMCWTRTSRSEAPWRFERAADENAPPERKWSSVDRTIVRVRTTPERLERTVLASADLQDRLRGKSFLVPVKHLRDHQVIQRFEALANCKAVGREAALALSFKRYPYRHEKEVRWVHVTNNLGASTGRNSIRVDPNVLFDQIMIDPRAIPDMACEVRQSAIRAGFRNAIMQSQLFELPERLRSAAQTS